MAEYANPSPWKSAPADGQVPVYEAATDTVVPRTVGSLPAAVIPQAHIAAAVDGTAQEGTANAATQTGSYVQADVQSITALANDLKAKYNTLQTSYAALLAKYNTLLTELQTAGILSSS